MIACQYCGTSNRADAAYCNTCGAALASAAPSAAAARAGTAAPPPGPRPRHGTGRLPLQSTLGGRYLILKKIGEGGMAAVYQATDTKTRQTVAIKEMSQDGLSPEEVKEAIESFQTEAEMLTRLRHANLPRVFAHFYEGARHYLVMEFIDGQTIEQRLTAKGGSALPEVEVMAWAKQLCAVLGYLHTQRPPIIFRDLKPANIMLTRGNQIKLIDFGIARVFAPGRNRDTQVLGTPGFAPPEQYGKAQTDPRADIYALGCTLFQVLSGYDPATTPFALPPLHSRNPRISPHIERAIERATRLDREARYPTIAAFEKDLLYPAGLMFRNGECAHNRGELIALCQRLPLDGAEHLYTDRVEHWLRFWGDVSGAANAARIRRTYTDQAAGLRAFLATATPTTARPQPAAKRTTGAAKATPPKATPPKAAPTRGPATNARATATHAAASAAAAPPAVMTVQPQSIHFGRLVAGQRGMQSIVISGIQGSAAQGQITPLVPWIQVDHPRFAAGTTLVQVIAETSKLAGVGVQQTSLQIALGPQRLFLPVTVEVLPAPTRATGKKAQATPQQPGATPAAAAKSARKVSAKYLVPAQTASPLARLATSFALALTLAMMMLVAVPQALLRYHVGVPQTWPIYLLTYALGALVAIPGAIAGMRVARWNGRPRATIIGTLVGLTAALLLGQGALFTGPLGLGHLLVPTLVGLGAAFGADARIGRMILTTASFISRRARIVISLAAVVLGAWGGALLAGQSGAGFLVPVGLIVGAFVGAALATNVNRLLQRAVRVYP